MPRVRSNAQRLEIHDVLQASHILLLLLPWSDSYSIFLLPSKVVHLNSNTEYAIIRKQLQTQLFSSNSIKLKFLSQITYSWCRISSEVMAIFSFIRWHQVEFHSENSSTLELASKSWGKWLLFFCLFCEAKLTHIVFFWFLISRYLNFIGSYNDIVLYHSTWTIFHISARVFSDNVLRVEIINDDILYNPISIIIHRKRVFDEEEIRSYRIPLPWCCNSPFFNLVLLRNGFQFMKPWLIHGKHFYSHHKLWSSLMSLHALKSCQRVQGIIFASSFCYEVCIKKKVPLNSSWIPESYCNE